MSDDQPAGSLAERLSAQAHDLRNQLATLRSVARLVDDAEVAEAMTAALDSLQVGIERAVVAARIELDRRPPAVELDSAELLRLGAARARREGAAAATTDDPGSVVGVAGDVLRGPGAWLERLVADVLHGDDPAWVDELASACAVAVERGEGRVELRALSAG